MNYTFVMVMAAAMSMLVVLWALIPIAEQFKLVDVPCERKNHHAPTPLIGGIAIFISTIVAMLIAVPFTAEVVFFLAACTTLVVVGVLDDKYDLSVRIRFCSHIIAASLLIFGADLHFSDLGYLFGDEVVLLGSLGVVFTYLAVMAAINAYNMIDGLDGLLGSQALVSLAAIAWLTYGTQQLDVYHVAMILCACLVPFLMINLRLIPSRAHVFMGDAGSMLLGLAIVWLFLKATQPSVPGTDMGVVIRPVTALWLVGLPIMDMIYVIWRRLYHLQNPVRPDQRHVHLLMKLAGYTSQQIVRRLFVLAMALAAIGVIGEYFKVAEVIMFSGFLIVYVIYTRIITRIKRLAGAETYTSLARK